MWPIVAQDQASKHWRGLKATFEIVPVLSGKDTAAVIEPHLGADLT